MRALLRSDRRALIRQKIANLASDPQSQSANVKCLQGRPEYRLRVQDWRVIFRIESDIFDAEGGILWIDEIGPRGSVYEG